MDIQMMINKLENYEQLAYEGVVGLDWLQEIGEGFKFYIMECKGRNSKPTIEGFMDYINKRAEEFLK